MLGAAAVFAVAIILAFSVNGGDNAGGGQAVAATDDPVEQSSDVGDSAETSEVEGSPDASTDAATDAAADAEAGASGEVESPDAEAAADQENVATDAGQAVAAEPKLTGFIIPIDGACLTEFEGHLPSTPREYRNGTHEGFDFYGWASCRTIDDGTAALAAKDGVIIRVDQFYTEITVAEFEEATDPAVATLHPDQREAFLDRLRGRQVWIDHGGGVVTRYAHLSAVAAGLTVGDEVRAGRVIGFVGESGQLEALTAPGTDWHLHFEIRVGDSYLGEGLTPAEARDLYLEAFGFEPAAGTQ